MFLYVASPWNMLFPLIQIINTIKTKTQIWCMFFINQPIHFHPLPHSIKYTKTSTKKSAHRYADYFQVNCFSNIQQQINIYRSLMDTVFVNMLVMIIMILIIVIPGSFLLSSIIFAFLKNSIIKRKLLLVLNQIIFQFIFLNLLQI